MTSKEQESVNSIIKLMGEIREENKKFREDISKQVDSISQKVEKKHLPIYHEQDILRVIQQSIGETIVKSLSGWDSPMTKLIKSVVEENSFELRQIISNSFSHVIKAEESVLMPIYNEEVVNRYLFY